MKSPTHATRQQRLSLAREAVLAQLLGLVDAQHPLVVLRAPPGSGKTFALTHALARALERGRRLAVATFTNAQADELSVRLAQRFPKATVVRWSSASHTPDTEGSSVRVVTSGGELPGGSAVIVATSAKWAVCDTGSFDALFVDEAWQLPWAEFLLLGKLAPTFVLVGDPGQIEPVVSVETLRWATAKRAPHRAAPEVALRSNEADARLLSLPVTTRLPADTAELVRCFYDFDFESWSAPGERSLELRPREGADGVDRALELLSSGSVSVLALPTPEEPLEAEDAEVARAAAEVVRRALARGARVRTEEGVAPLRPEDVGVVASHRVLVARITRELGPLAAKVRVETAERWQGLERALMVAVHPLSGVREPSDFDLATGRLCVMTSRHRVGLVLVTRDHVGETLASHRADASHALGEADLAGQGQARHEAAWAWLQERGRIAA